MGITIDQIIADAIQETGIFEDVITKVKALPPPATRKLADYGPVLGLDPSGDLYKQLVMIDTIEAQVKASAAPAKP